MFKLKFMTKTTSLNRDAAGHKLSRIYSLTRCESISIMKWRERKKSFEDKFELFIYLYSIYYNVVLKSTN